MLDTAWVTADAFCISEPHGRAGKTLALALLKDDTLSDHDAKLVQSLYNAILDWDARDKEGLDPIKGA